MVDNQHCFDWNMDDRILFLREGAANRANLVSSWTVIVHRSNRDVRSFEDAQ